jgi:hypothetical protein
MIKDGLIIANKETQMFNLIWNRIGNFFVRKLKHKVQIEQHPPDCFLRLYSRDPEYLHMKMSGRKLEMLHDGGYIRYIQKDFKNADND